MQKYGGEQVYSLRDEYGLIEVIDSAGIRSLHFETPIQQSSIDLRQPERLVFEYYRVMCTALLFPRTLDNLLVLGLGGGALTRYLLEAKPQTSITAVEFREGVVDVAFDWFQLPISPRLETWVTDAHAYVVQTKQRYDVIFVDLYDALGMSESLSELRFLDDCLATLTPGGALSINLWRNQKEAFHRSQEILTHLFGTNVLYLDVDDANTVALAMNTNSVAKSNKALKQAARDLETKTGLNLIGYLKRLNRRDGSGLG